MLSQVSGATSLGLFAHIPVEDPQAMEASLAAQGVQVRSSAGGMSLIPSLSVSAKDLAQGLGALDL
jgi:hypothetical protein